MNFLKNIFGLKKDKVEKPSKNVVVINISDIDEWVKVNCSDIDPNYFSRKFSDILEEISKNCENLLKVKFEGDTDPRIKQRVESNIDSYVKHTRAFIKKIDTSLLKHDIKQAINSYEHSINNFNLQTQKNFLIVSALFKDDAFRVSNSFKRFSLTLEDLKRGLLDSKSILGLDIYGKVSKVKNNIVTKRKFLSEEKEKTEEIEILEKEILEKKQNVKDFTESKEYKEIVNSDKKKEAFQVELEHIKSDIFSIISTLEPAFRRLVRIMPNIDIRDISLDRVLEPANRKIFGYSKELKESLNSLDIKEDKKERVSVELEKIFDGTFDMLRNSYFEKIQEIKNIDTMMIDSQVSKMFIDLNYKINSLDYKKTRLQGEVEKLKKRNLDIEEDFSNLVIELESCLSSASGYSVKIKF